MNCYSLTGIEEDVPPPSPVVIPTVVIENSLNVTISTFTPSTVSLYIIGIQLKCVNANVHAVYSRRTANI